MVLDFDVFVQWGAVEGEGGSGQATTAIATVITAVATTTTTMGTLFTALATNMLVQADTVPKCSG